MRPPVVLLALFYGDYADLARRLVESWKQFLDFGPVLEVRLGLNSVGDRTEDYLRETFRNWPPVPGGVKFYMPDENVGKYPLMRRMLYDDPLPEDALVMWWDDDSYLDHPRPDWWDRIYETLAEPNSCLGEIWYRRLWGRQDLMLAKAPWVEQSWGNLPRPAKHRKYAFLQGSWWVIPYKLLSLWNWPIPELHHCGGDLLWGTVCYYQGYRMGHFNQGVRLNADAAGKPSGALRRGIDQPLLGYRCHEVGMPGVEHQEFSYAMSQGETGTYRLLAAQSHLKRTFESSRRRSVS